MHANHNQHRRGISLIEVLISIGILAIGLTSVIALIPAGKSEAGKAVVLDRVTAMAANGLADAMTIGLTRPDSFLPTSVSGSVSLVFDPLGSVIPGTQSLLLKQAGVLANSSSSTTVTTAVTNLFAQGRDDLVYAQPATEDDLPSNSFFNNARGFNGRMTNLFALSRSGSGTFTPGDIVTLSVVVFHNRDRSTPVVTGTWNNTGTLTIDTTTLPADRSAKSVVRPGTVVYCADANTPPLRFAQLAMASVDADGTTVYVTFSGRQPTTPSLSWLNGSEVSILVDSVGLAEWIVPLEGSGPYAR